jgi:NAD(P)-dependent dehydrogenase (short-subunit alcohol dehydrogenase family)
MPANVSQLRKRQSVTSSLPLPCQSIGINALGGGRRPAPIRRSPWDAYLEKLPLSPGPAPASAAPPRSCSPPKGPKSSSARGARELDELAAQIRAAGGEAAALAGDVRSEDYAKALVALAVERYARLDVAFNNAGTLGEGGPSTGVSEAGWNDAIAINLTGSFLGAKHQIAQMLEHGGGSVIFTSTFVGHTFAFPGVAAYAASKSGLIGLTQALAAEFGPQGVRVNAILPGAVDTEMYRSMNNTAESQAFVTCTPLSAWPAPRNWPVRCCIWPRTIRPS